jgi:hypothetical protein
MNIETRDEERTRQIYDHLLQIFNSNKVIHHERVTFILNTLLSMLPDSFENVPNEVLNIIFCFVILSDQKTGFVLPRVCKRWKNMFDGMKKERLDIYHKNNPYAAFVIWMISFLEKQVPNHGCAFTLKAYVSENNIGGDFKTHYNQNVTPAKFDIESPRGKKISILIRIDRMSLVTESIFKHCLDLKKEVGINKFETSIRNLVEHSDDIFRSICNEFEFSNIFFKGGIMTSFIDCSREADVFMFKRGLGLSECHPNNDACKILFKEINLTGRNKLQKIHMPFPPYDLRESVQNSLYQILVSFNEKHPTW